MGKPRPNLIGMNYYCGMVGAHSRQQDAYVAALVTADSGQALGQWERLDVASETVQYHQTTTGHNMYLQIGLDTQSKAIVA